MKQIKVAELMFDYTLYPRNNIDAGNVRFLVDAISAKVDLPPIVVEKDSLRIVDGFHRGKAYLRVLGEDGEITVLPRKYKSEAHLFLEAMRLNANHGVKLDPCDRMHCLIIADRLKIDEEEVAGALNMPTERLAKLRSTRTGFTKNGQPLALKNTIRKQFAGKKLTKRQEEANGKFSGWSQVFYVNQVIELIESNMLDVENESLMGRIKVLDDLLKEKVFVSF